MRGHALRTFLALGLVIVMGLCASPGGAGEAKPGRWIRGQPVDPANAFPLIHQVELPPFELIPDAPYTSLHFTNGSPGSSGSPTPSVCR
jgi:hypothetical protein